MRRLAAWVLCAGLALAARPAGADVTIKLGTLAPDGSAWHLLLKELAERWATESGGKVKLKIYPGGVAGNEGDMVRKIRVGQLHAAAITMIGLHDIDASPQAIGAPGLIGSEAELHYVHERMAPVWEKKLEEKGFVVLAWGDTGWAHFFTKKETRTPAQAAGMKVFAWAGDPSSVEAWKAAGFQPVVISATDMLPSLSTGMIEGYATSPIMSMSARWYEQAKYMPDVNWGRLIGATVVKKDVWEKIPEDLRPKLLATAREVGGRVDTAVAKMAKDSVASMQKNGLTVMALTDVEKAEWQKAAEKAWPVIRGGVVPVETFDEVKRLRDEYRAGGGK